jgi:hypothetical protein
MAQPNGLLNYDGGRASRHMKESAEGMHTEQPTLHVVRMLLIVMVTGLDG